MREKSGVVGWGGILTWLGRAGWGLGMGYSKVMLLAKCDNLQMHPTVTSASFTRIEQLGVIRFSTLFPKKMQKKDQLFTV